MKGTNLLLPMIQLIPMVLLLATCGAPEASPTPLPPAFSFAPISVNSELSARPVTHTAAL